MRGARLGGAILGVCLALGLVETAQVRFGAGEVVEPTWWIAFWRVVPSWILLAALSPLVVWAADRWPVRGPGWSGALVRHLLLAFPFALLHLVLVALWASVRPGAVGLGLAEGVGWLASRYLAYGVLSYGALLGVVHAFRYHYEAERTRRDADALVAEVERARREAMEGKLHPHFVFNTLNAITGLAARGDAPAVVRTLDAFSELLQATLDERVLRPVPLREELELLARYVDIQKVRFGSRLRMGWDVDDASLDDPVPGLLLQPLVENALAHAIGRNPAGGDVTVRVRRSAEGLVVEVEDTGAGDGRPARNGGRGIGLDAPRARLASLYEGRASLELAPVDGGGTVARVFIPRASTWP